MVEDWYSTDGTITEETWEMSARLEIIDEKNPGKVRWVLYQTNHLSTKIRGTLN